jgi:hypothetical protein
LKNLSDASLIAYSRNIFAKQHFFRIFIFKGNLEYLRDVHFDYDTPLIVETGASDWRIDQILLRGESSLFYLRYLEFLNPKKKFDDDDFISLNSRRSASSGIQSDT